MKKIFLIIACLLTQLTNTIDHIVLRQSRKQHQQTFKNFCKQEVSIIPARIVGSGMCGLFTGLTYGLSKGVEVPSHMRKHLLEGALCGVSIGFLCGLLIAPTAITLKISDMIYLRIYNFFTSLKIIT